MVILQIFIAILVGVIVFVLFFAIVGLMAGLMLIMTDKKDQLRLEQERQRIKRILPGKWFDLYKQMENFNHEGHIVTQLGDFVPRRHKEKSALILQRVLKNPTEYPPISFQGAMLITGMAGTYLSSMDAFIKG